MNALGVSIAEAYPTARIIGRAITHRLRKVAELSTKDVRYPLGGSWPALMRADMAAAYLDEPDCAAFLRKVRAGTYPKGIRFRGCRLRWRRSELDATIEHRPRTICLDDDL